MKEEEEEDKSLGRAQQNVNSIFFSTQNSGTSAIFSAKGLLFVGERCVYKLFFSRFSFLIFLSKVFSELQNCQYII